MGWRWYIAGYGCRLCIPGRTSRDKVSRNQQRVWLRSAGIAAALAAGCLSAGAQEAVVPDRAAQAVAPAGDNEPAPTAAGSPIAEWIEQLGSPQFAQREAASRSLADAGRAALGPLTAAIQRDDLEIASRAMEIVRGFLVDPQEGAPEGAAEGSDGDAAGVPADRAALAAESERLLEIIAEGPESPVTQLAQATLEFHQLGMAQAARERLEALGAVVTEGFMPSGRRGMQVVVNASWRGDVEDLRLLPRLRGVVHVGVHGVRLDAPTLAALGRMRGVELFHLYGTGVSDEAVAALAGKFPDAEIDVRKGGKLGVAGQRTVGPCLITQVLAGSAADKAGIQIGDVVVRMDGEPIANFEALTEKVGTRGPGEAIDMEIERGIPATEQVERITCKVKLDGWD